MADVLNSFYNYVFAPLSNLFEFENIANLLQQKIYEINSITHYDNVNQIDLIDDEINILRESNDVDSDNMIYHLENQKPKKRIINVIDSILNEL